MSGNAMKPEIRTYAPLSIAMRCGISFSPRRGMYVSAALMSNSHDTSYGLSFVPFPWMTNFPSAEIAPSFSTSLPGRTFASLIV